jgi:hypothetical protein
MAMFGPTAGVERGTVGDMGISAEVVFLEEYDACGPIESSAEEGVPLSTWSKGFFGRWLHTNRNDSRSNGIHHQAMEKTIYKGKILVVKRGKCSFEDKVELLESWGAVAVIIENSDEALFVMAGREQGGAANPLPRKEGTVSIHSVMITQFDSQSLQQDIQDLAARGLKVKVKLHVERIPIILDWESFGNFDYPKGIVTKGYILATSSGEWGVKMWLVNNQWQVLLPACNSYMFMMMM